MRTSSTPSHQPPRYLTHSASLPLLPCLSPSLLESSLCLLFSPSYLSNLARHQPRSTPTSLDTTESSSHGIIESASPRRARPAACSIVAGPGRRPAPSSPGVLVSLNRASSSFWRRSPPRSCASPLRSRPGPAQTASGGAARPASLPWDAPPELSRGAALRALTQLRPLSESQPRRAGCW
jgi:hypothetical protein